MIPRTRPRLHAQRSERTRAGILDAAEELLTRNGFEGTRVETIARRAGIRRATLFYDSRGVATGEPAPTRDARQRASPRDGGPGHPPRAAV